MASLPQPDYKGKVRDLYFIDDEQMIINASDRISAFDVIFNEIIPNKGKTLNNISNLWFQSIRDSGLQSKFEFADQMISSNVNEYPSPFTKSTKLEGRSVLVKRTQRIDFECVVRGYLAGSGWKEYEKTQTVCSQKLPAGLQEAQKLEGPIFTPATKAQIGDHDENVSFNFMEKKIGNELAGRLKTISIAIYSFAAQKMEEAGYILCDTKFEFGLLEDKIILIDEALTPDSSRYWKKSDYKPGHTPPGFDKQYIRDFVAGTGWDKTPPAPTLPDDVVQKTQELYLEIEGEIQKILKA